MPLLPPIGELLPHAPPSLLLEELLELSEDRALTRAKVHEPSLFGEPDGVPAVVALELMAQTIAALCGARRRELGLPPQVGLLVGCRQLTLEVDYFRSDDELLIEARRAGSFEALGQYDCQVFRAGAVLARGELTVYDGPFDRI